MSTIGFLRCRRSSEARTRPAGLVRAAAAIPLALMAAVVFAAAAHAATVRAVQGQVLVNSGQGYRLVDSAIELDPGGTVVANPGAIAEVVYPGGCKVTVQPGSVYLVAAQPPCQSANVERPPRERTERTERTEDRTETANPSGGGVSNGTAWVLGAVAVIGGGAAAYFLIPPLSP